MLLSNRKAKTPWPTKAAMNQIYEKHLWGGKDFDFFSGSGSHDPEIITPYLKSVTDFLKSFKAPLTVLDLGCGDFNIGQHLEKCTKHYIAVDIVESLIERNKTKFKANNLEFLCMDISKDKWPKADCIILRQVLQHLSNAEIQKIVKKLVHYKYIILTEHIPTGDFEPNKCIISGQGNRVKYSSGVDLLSAPFNFKVIEEKTLLTCFLNNRNSEIETKLFRTR